MKRAAIFVLGFMLLNLHALAQQAEWPVLTCDTLDECMKHVETPDSCEPECGGLVDASKGYFSLQDAFNKFGRPAIPRLLENLKSPHESVRSRAGVILNTSPYVKPEDHAAILKSYGQGNSWLSDVAQKAATPESVAEMGDALQLHAGHEISMPRDGQSNLSNSDVIHETDASYSDFLRLGPLAETYLIKRFDCRDDKACEYLFLPIFAAAFEPDGPAMPRFASHMFDLAERQSLPVDIRKAAMKTGLSALGNVRSDAVQLKLQRLLDSEVVDIRDMAYRLLIGSTDKTVLEETVRRVEIAKGLEALSAITDLGRFGARGAVAVPALLTGLKDDDPFVRNAAAFVLGEIKDQRAAAALVSSVTAEDWELSLTAIIALGNMPNAPEVKQLSDAAENHWHPAVKAAAKLVLAGKPLPKGESPFGSFAEVFCKGIMPAQFPPKRGSAVQSQADMDELNSWTDSVWEAFQRDAEATSSFQSTRDLQPTLQIDGWAFSGEDHGEWGGTVTAVKSGVPPITLANLNLKGFFQSATGNYFVTGLSHLSLDGAFLHKLTRLQDGSWRADVIMRLTGNGKYTVSENGTLRVIGYSGAMLVHPDGKPEWIMCPPNIDY